MTQMELPLHHVTTVPGEMGLLPMSSGSKITRR